MERHGPVLIIGLDAACWDLINPLLGAGLLPNIDALMTEGSYGRLHSIVSYPSPALWTSIITGKLPEKHGVLDFYSATRHHLRVSTLYEILSGGDGSVGLFRWLASWPPSQDTRFCVPSYTARTPETHPEELRFLNDLARPSGLKLLLTGGLRLFKYGVGIGTVSRCAVEILYEAIVRPEQRDWWYRRRLLETKIFGEVFACLLRRYQPGFSAILFSVLDDFSHHYWKYREPGLFNDVTEPEVRKYGQVIDKGYIAVDQAVGRILESLPKDALIVIVSDHGQQPISPKVRPYRISVQKLARILGFQDRVWVTDLVFSALFRPRSSEDGQITFNELAETLSKIRLQDNGTAVFAVSREDTTALKVKVSLTPETPLDSTVVLPDGRSVQLSEIIFTRGRISGQHSEWGIFIMKGPGIRKSHEVHGATVLDITPTILALCRHPVGRDMDGDEIDLTEDQLKILEDKLRDLGYLT